MPVRRVARAARRLLEQQEGQAEDRPRDAGDEKCRPPAPVAADRSADDVAQRRADRDRGVEDRQHPGPALGGVVVRDQRRRDHAVARLADADQRPRAEQNGEGRRGGGPEGGEDGAGDEELAASDAAPSFETVPAVHA